MSTTIPSPRGIPLLGHIFAVGDSPTETLTDFAREHGEAYQLNFLGRRVIVVNTAALQNEVSNERKFVKGIIGALLEVRNIAGDGLFTANKEEPNWGIAHRLLTPMFRTTYIQEMFADMYDISSQLILKWERFGPEYRIDPAQDFSALTMDIILLCSMSYRLNSFYRESPHPFMQAMTDFLLECGSRPRRPSIVSYFMSGTNAKFKQDVDTMIALGDKIIADRKRNPTDKNDLLNIMMYQKDPKTGQGLSDEAVRNNLMTFMIAGHETTAGMLTFCLYYLIKDPERMRKAQSEVDDILGDGQLQLGDLSKLKYINAIIREALRLGPPVPFRQVFAQEDTTLGGGKYFVQKGQSVIINVYMAQRDLTVWGLDADEFRPERMLDGKFEAMPPNSWQPFGFGSRICLGRPLAWQEAQIALIMMLQKFDFEFADGEPGPGLRQNLTIRPEDYHIHARVRTRNAHS